MSEFFPQLCGESKIHTSIPSFLLKIHPDNLILNKIPEIRLKRIESLCGIADKIEDNWFLCMEI